MGFAPQLKRNPLGSMLMTFRAITTTALLALYLPLPLPGQASTAPSALPKWALGPVAHIPAAQAAISGLSPAHQLPDVERALGRPDSVVKGYSEIIDSTRTLYYRDAEATLSPAGLEYFDCWGKRCRLRSGVAVGSTLRTVVQALGRGHPGYGPEISHSLIYTIDRCDCWLEVRFDESLRVVRLSLANDNS